MKDNLTWTPGLPGFSHESAVTASVSFPTALPFSQIRCRLMEIMTDLFSWVEEQGGVIGHIKATVTASDGRIWMYSLTDREPQEKEASVSGPKETNPVSHIQAAAIVYFVKEAELQSKFKLLCQSLEPLPGNKDQGKGQTCFKKISARRRKE